jgi:acyl transferase domain-containing protein/SAM-dependent methyltransferase
VDQDGLSAVKRALLRQRELTARVRELESEKSVPIAIVGIGCRFPGGIHDPDSFWALLRDGKDAISEVDPERWSNDDFYDANPDAPGKITTRWGGFLNDIYAFDPHFFGISPREALSMDPQQRILLEVCWEALENAGIAPAGLARSSTGVFVGMATGDYETLEVRSLSRHEIDAYTSIGTAESVASGRISYQLGLVGPSLSVNTACSSSLVAVHLACQSLRLGECRQALAAGINAILAYEHSISLSKAGMMAADGRCKTFDAAADGFVRAEGCGVVVLKRHRDAIADGDNILAIIRGTAINHDGRSNGLTAPNGPSQEAVIKAALLNGRVDRHSVSFIETHGTGTALGDPIEVQALGAVFGPGRDPANPLMLGSVKTNLGHMESAAGIGSLIKVVLALKHAEIPRNLNFSQPNPHIAWGELPVTVVAEPRPWHEVNGTRLAGVSSFGFSGSNAHVVVEQAPAMPAANRKDDRPAHLCCLSAQTGNALAQLADRFIQRLDTAGDLSLPDVCYSANVGRNHQRHRIAVRATSVEQLRTALRQHFHDGGHPFVHAADAGSHADCKPVFLFSGQGDQHFGMGAALYRDCHAFRSAIDRCDELLQPYLGHSLVDLLYRDRAREALVHETRITQPALFALQYALAEMWRSWGVAPAAVAGHSVGEITAACVAGALPLEDAARLVAERGRLTQAIEHDGAMGAVRASEARVRDAIESTRAAVTIAAINGPDNVVISGLRPDVLAALAHFESAGVNTRQLAVSTAFHSPWMEPVRKELARVAAGLHFTEPAVDIVSTVTGRPLDGAAIADPDYWAGHVVMPVRFQAAIQSLCDLSHEVFVELGPHTTLVGMGAACRPDGEGTWLPSLKKNEADWDRVLDTLAVLYARGADIDWHGFDAEFDRRRVPLPTYPFQREVYRVAPAPVPGERRPAANAVWPVLERAASAQAAQVPLDLRLETYQEKWECLDRLTTSVVFEALRSIGAFDAGRGPVSADKLIAELGIKPMYRDLMSIWLHRLARASVLSAGADGYTVLRAVPESAWELAIEEARRQLGDIPVLMQYCERCIGQIVPILLGKVNAIDTIFPEGSFATAEFLYRDWGLPRYFNNIVARVLETFLASLGPGPLRILEVGAGTGGTTSSLLPLLPPDRTEYRFTDLSELFLNRARDIFSDYPFVRYGILDIGSDPVPQGYETGSFDVIVAANSLHATADLSRTIGHARSLLAPGGLLLLYEVTQHLPWFEITVALIEGWQLYEDELRMDNPLVSADKWRSALSARGFDTVATWPGDGSPAGVLGHHVIIARATSAGERALPRRENLRADVAPTLVSTAGPLPQPAFLDDLRAASPDSRREMLVEFVKRQVMSVLRLDDSRSPDRKGRLMDLGVDSLMAVELRKRIGVGIGNRDGVPSTLIFDYPTIELVAGFLLDLLQLGEKPADAPPETPEAATHLDDLSEDELELELLKRLDRR